jgi:hypothetical protein
MPILQIWWEAIRICRQTSSSYWGTCYSDCIWRRRINWIDWCVHLPRRSRRRTKIRAERSCWVWVWTISAPELIVVVLLRISAICPVSLNAAVLVKCPIRWFWSNLRPNLGSYWVSKLFAYLAGETNKKETNSSHFSVHICIGFIFMPVIRFLFFILSFR